MKGFIPVEIPTKRYILAYLYTELGDKLIIKTDCHIGSKLYDLLEHEWANQKQIFKPAGIMCS